MLSVVLYGRNDSHGYNLHKRAAISLNAIAELLTDPDDEILFVDYNTPDDLPTFPEAIADTLTEKAVARLRVLRVRPEIHRTRFAARTHLVALEPIARNVAIRRSNPANRWVLSTNTDMIFCPRREGQTLTSIVGELNDGFYHLPRFELPEGLWESLDRKDAPRLISAAREWGERFHLNEITLADRGNVYDAPGDFQLFLRQDLFEIDGFHEEMILGWHLDANIAKRMRFKRGQVDSALESLVGYHCDHTRRSSPYHKADRAENDQVRFGDNVAAPEIPEQAESWGLADVQIETFTLGQASAARYLKGLQATIATPLEGFLQTQYLLEDYGRLDYPCEHVLPYLLDAVSCLPADTRIGYIGCRADTLQKFAAGWVAMGGAPLCLADDDETPAQTVGITRLPMAGWLDECDMFVFEVGAQQSSHHLNLTEQDSAKLWRVDNAFKRAVDRDLQRQAAGAAPRRAVIVNGVHNFFEPQMMAEVAVTLTPYSSRVRHGYIADRSANRRAGAAPASLAAMDGLGALEPPAQTDLKRIDALLHKLASKPSDEDWRGARRIGQELETLIVYGLVGADVDTAPIIAQIRQSRPSNQTPARDVVDASAGRGAASRLVRLEDWDDPVWAHLARRLFSNRDHNLLYGRETWTWERVSLTQNLMACVPPTDRPTVLVAGQSPELLAFALAHQGYDIDIVDPTTLGAGAPQAIDWRGQFLSHGWVSPRPVGLIQDRAAALAEGFRYDAVLLPQNALFAKGRAEGAQVLRAAADLLRVGGHLGLSIFAQPLNGDDRLQAHTLPRALTTNGVFAQAVQNLTDLAMQGDVDGRLTPRSLDRTAETPPQTADAPPPLIFGPFPHLDVPGIWAFRKADRPSDWPALQDVLEQGVYLSARAPSTSAGSLFTAQDIAQAPIADGPARLGSCFDALLATPPLTRSPLVLAIPAGFGDGVAAIAALGRISPGHYEIDIELGARESGVGFAAGVVIDGRVVAEQTLEVADASPNHLYIPVNIGSEGRKGVALLIKALGESDCEILNLVLR
jgi:hypothetical protein